MCVETPFSVVFQPLFSNFFDFSLLRTKLDRKEVDDNDKLLIIVSMIIIKCPTKNAGKMTCIEGGKNGGYILKMRPFAAHIKYSSPPDPPPTLLFALH